MRRALARSLTGWGLLLATLLLSPPARAQASASESPEAPVSEQPETPAQPERTTPEQPEPPPGEELLGLPLTLGSVEVGGRVSVRETLEAPRGGAWAGELSIAAARVELTYRYKKRLRAVVEFDASGDLKDAFAWLKISKFFAVRAGQFKVPLSLIELESTPRLPVARRGLLRDALDDALGFTGRQPGAQLEWKCDGCAQDLKLRAGVWQTRDPEKKVALDTGLGLVPTVRGTWDLGSLELGASALVRPSGANAGSSETSWLAAIDAHHELPLGSGGLRTWAEVLGGRATFLIDTEGPLLMARALTAWRLGGLKKGAAYFEPFLMLTALDPDLDRSADLLWEGTVGLNAGQWERWRVQAQFELRRAGAEAPPSLLALEDNLVSRRALVVQLEVVF